MCGPLADVRPPVYVRPLADVRPLVDVRPLADVQLLSCRAPGCYTLKERFMYYEYTQAF